MHKYIIVTIIIVRDTDKVYRYVFLIALKIMHQSIKVHEFPFPFMVS